MEYLERHWWPGNVRELSHLLEAALILAGPGPLQVEVLEDAASMAAVDGTGTLGGSRHEGVEGGGEEGGWLPGTPTSAERRRYSFSGTPDEEREAIRGVLQQVRGNRTRAARRLGMARNTLRKKMTDYGLD
jgi:Nif-specific regulatory protein